MQRLATIITTFTLVLSAPLQAGGVLHDGNKTFLFGNQFDTHQESRLKNKGTLQGQLYIIPKILLTGETVWVHPRGEAKGETCGVDVECTVGWNFTAISGDAKFLFGDGVNGNDHAAWMVNRSDIEQPGSNTHFQWIANAGPVGTTTDDRFVEKYCDKVNASGLQSETPKAIDQFCAGWFIELKAVRSFTFEHGGEKIAIRPGIDNASHLNILTNFNNEVIITQTR